MPGKQSGGAFGTMVILVLLAVGGYYAYTEIIAPTAPPSCKEMRNSCIAKCRRSSTEAPALQACQDSCERDAAACK